MYVCMYLYVICTCIEYDMGSIVLLHINDRPSEYVLRIRTNKYTNIIHTDVRMSTLSSGGMHRWHNSFPFSNNLKCTEKSYTNITQHIHTYGCAQTKSIYLDIYIQLTLTGVLLDTTLALTAEISYKLL